MVNQVIWSTRLHGQPGYHHGSPQSMLDDACLFCSRSAQVGKFGEEVFDSAQATFLSQKYTLFNPNTHFSIKIHTFQSKCTFFLPCRLFTCFSRSRSAQVGNFGKVVFDFVQAFFKVRNTQFSMEYTFFGQKTHFFPKFFASLRSAATRVNPGCAQSNRVATRLRNNQILSAGLQPGCF